MCLLTMGLADVGEAFAAAEAELGAASPDETEETMPVSEVEAEGVDEQAELAQDEQPDVAETTEAEVDDELQSLVDELADDEEEDSEDNGEADPIDSFLSSDEFWETTLEVDLGEGPQELTVQEMWDGYLRQSDYTKKTQALAAERETVNEAVDFHKAFMEEPLAFAHTLAVRAGLINEGDQPVKDIEAAKIKTPEEIEAEIERRVEERFTSDERFTEMQIQSARSEVNRAFDEIESARGITLSPEVRQHIVDVSVRQGTTDFEMVLDAEMYRQQQNRKRVADKQRNAPARPSKAGAAGGANPPAQKSVVDDVDEAWRRAEAELAAVGGDVG